MKIHNETYPPMLVFFGNTGSDAERHVNERENERKVLRLLDEEDDSAFGEAAPVAPLNSAPSACCP